MLALCFKKEKASDCLNLGAQCLQCLFPNAECEDDSAQEAVAVNIVDNTFPVQTALNRDQIILLHICKVHGHQRGRIVDLKRKEIEVDFLREQKSRRCFHVKIFSSRFTAPGRLSAFP